MKILLADDNPEVRSAMRLLLEQEPNLQIVEVADTATLLAELNENCPKVILLDWELPGLLRENLLSALRSRCPKVKVIALSSRFEAKNEALEAGMEGFISKGESSEDLLSTLFSLFPTVE